MSLSSSSSVSRLQASQSSAYSLDSENNRRSLGCSVSVRDDVDFDDDDRWGKKRKKKKRGMVLAGVLDSPAMRRMRKLRLHIVALGILLVIVVFEVRHLSQDRPTSTIRDTDAKGKEEADSLNEASSTVIRDVERPKNLDNMDMPMRKVGGKEEACLKLLPPEDLDKIELPEASFSGVRILSYVHNNIDSKESKVQDSSMASAFGGYQTMDERAKTFELRDTMVVHCGFCEEGSGFDIDSTDKSFMESCIIVVVTCTFGGGDDLYQPIGMTRLSISRVCYVAFWDEVTLEAQAKEGKAPDPMSRKVGLWRIVIVRNLPFSDQRRNGKIPKLLNHRLFPRARYSIWVDSKSQFRRDPIGVLEALLWKPKVPFAISEHGGRSCVYKEGDAIVQKHKALPGEVSIQLNMYRSEGIPERALFHGHKALAEASVIVREHTPLTNLFMCLWFNEVMRFTARDQLSFPYVLLRVHAMQVNMFPVCTRRALVNSIGHKSKAKPLNIK
ncbi:protein MpSRI3 [Marchantia polymorpha subsp. ruderalis]